MWYYHSCFSASLDLSEVPEGPLEPHQCVMEVCTFIWTVQSCEQGVCVRFHVCVKLCVGAPGDPWGSLSSPLHPLAVWGRDLLKSNLRSVGGPSAVLQPCQCPDPLSVQRCKHLSQHSRWVV